MRKRKPSMLNLFYERMIDFWLSNNSELTSKMLSDKLRDLFGITVSTSLVAKTRKKLGWTTRRVKYCQLISKVNRQRRLEWCLKALKSRDTFENVIFVNETTVEMSSNGKFFSINRIPYYRRYQQGNRNLNMHTR